MAVSGAGENHEDEGFFRAEVEEGYVGSGGGDGDCMVLGVAYEK